MAEPLIPKNPPSEEEVRFQTSAYAQYNEKMQRAKNNWTDAKLTDVSVQKGTAEEALKKAAFLSSSYATATALKYKPFEVSSYLKTEPTAYQIQNTANVSVGSSPNEQSFGMLQIKPPGEDSFRTVNMAEKIQIQENSKACSVGQSAEERFLEQIRRGETPDNIPEAFKDAYANGASADELEKILKEKVNATFNEKKDFTPIQQKMTFEGLQKEHYRSQGITWTADSASQSLFEKYLPKSVQNVINPLQDTITKGLNTVTEAVQDYVVKPITMTKDAIVNVSSKALETAKENIINPVTSYINDGYNSLKQSLGFESDTPAVEKSPATNALKDTSVTTNINLKDAYDMSLKKGESLIESINNTPAATPVPKDNDLSLKEGESLIESINKTPAATAVPQEQESSWYSSLKGALKDTYNYIAGEDAPKPEQKAPTPAIKPELQHAPGL